jgi:hypothetical protein
MSKKLNKRISTLRLSENDYQELENLLVQKKKKMGLRGESLTLPDVVREAIGFFLAYEKGDFIGEPSRLEASLNEIIAMKNEIGELASFVKFLKNQTNSTSNKGRAR